MLRKKLAYNIFKVSLIILVMMLGNASLAEADNYSLNNYFFNFGVSSELVFVGEPVSLWAEAPLLSVVWAEISNGTRVDCINQDFLFEGFFTAFIPDTYSITFYAQEAITGDIHTSTTSITIVVRDNSGYVKGCIIDSFSGAPISGVRINGTGSASTRSETNGCYALPDSPGNYSVTAESEYYESSSKEVSITSGNITQLNISMIPKVVSKGDVSGDGNIDLQDAILTLRTLTGISQAGCKGADVNNDNRIGLEEAIYILQQTAELR